MRVASANAGSDQVIASFGRSLPKMIGLLMLGVLMTGAGAAIALGDFGAPDAYRTAVGSVAALFFGLCTVAILVRSFRIGPVVVVTRAGIADRRRSEELILWQMVSDISVRAIKRQRFLVLQLRPGVVPAAGSRYARAIDMGNQALGFSGVWISMTGLDGSLDDLLDAVARARSASGPRGS